MPKEAVQFAMQAKQIFFFEEGQRYGGIGETFADKLFQYGYRGFYKNTGIQGQFAAQNTVQGLLKFYQLDADSMVQAIKESEET